MCIESNDSSIHDFYIKTLSASLQFICGACGHFSTLVVDSAAHHLSLTCPLVVLTVGRP